MSSNFNNNPFFSDAPFNLKLRHVITSSGPIGFIPSSIKRVYAVCIGGGGGGGNSQEMNYRYVTAISGDGTTITYTCNNNIIAGMQVTITGSNITGYNGTFTVASASATQFTVTNSATGTHTAAHAYAFFRTITTGASSGGTITAITPSSPSSTKVTYATTTTVPVNSIVVISGCTPTGYNGTYVVTDSTPGTSFAVASAATGTATVFGTFVGPVTYTAANIYSIGDAVTMSSHVPTGYNQSPGIVIAANSTSYTINTSSIAQGTAWTSGGTSTLSTDGGGGAGGGAGGFAAGWTYVPESCTVGAGGAGADWSLGTDTFSSSNVFENFLMNQGGRGGHTQFGMVFAGGGGGGLGANISVTRSQTAIGGGASGGGNPTAAIVSTTAGYTGTPTGNVTIFSYAGFGSQTGTGGPGVSGGGAGGSSSAATPSTLTGNAGGRGVIGGGGGAAHNFRTATGGAGGAGDRYAGGTGSTGTGIGFGAGGGGGGYLGAGGNGSGKQGGTGGFGGGGGGASSGSKDTIGGAGGQGCILIYY